MSGKKCDVKPFPASCRDVRPFEGPMRTTGREIALFDSVASELVQRAGTVIDYYAIDIAGSDRDPLYDEPTARRFRGPFRLKAFVAYADSQPDPRQEGFVNSWASSAWIPRVEFEKSNFGDIQPGEGDIIRVWNLPYFNEAAVDDESVPGAGFYFNVVNVSNDGHLFDQPQFVGFTFQLARNTEFTPERRIEGST